MSEQHPLAPPPDKQAWEVSGLQVHARHNTGDGRPDIITFVASFATEEAANRTVYAHNQMLVLARHPEIASRFVPPYYLQQEAAGGASEPFEWQPGERKINLREAIELILSRMPFPGPRMTRQLHASGHMLSELHARMAAADATDVEPISRPGLTREWLEETRKPAVPVLPGMAQVSKLFEGVADEFDRWGPEDKARVQALTISLPCEAFASAGGADARRRGRAAILAKLVEWRRTGGVAFLGFYTDGEEDGGAQHARDIFRIEGVIDLGELIEAFAIAAAGLNMGERLDIAEAECAALAEANARYRILLDK